MFFKPEEYIKDDKKIDTLTNNGTAPEAILSEQMKDRGITVNSNNKYEVQASKFIRYALKRTDIFQKGEGFWFYNYKDNQYYELSDSRIRKVFFSIFCEADEKIWNSTIERQYMDFFKRIVNEAQVTGYEPGILQFTNGIVKFVSDDLADNEYFFAEPSPEYFCNFRLPYAFDENAECPMFIRFLNGIFSKDTERISLIQEIMGACLLYDDCIQKLIVFLGNGSNGKSLLATVIKNMLGKANVSAIALDKLGGERFSKQNLDNKLLNISSETDYSKHYTTSDLKTLTGGDSVEIEKKFQDSYTAEIHSKFILLANDMIQTSDYSDGFYRRLLIVPFNKQYIDLPPGAKKVKGKCYRDPDLEKKLLSELPGIFNFALDGLFRLRQNKFSFTTSKACEKALERYKNQHNVVKGFVKECIKVTGVETDKIKKTETFTMFINYCRKNNYNNQLRKISKDKFYEMLEAQILTDTLPTDSHKSNGYWYYFGVKTR